MKRYPFLFVINMLAALFFSLSAQATSPCVPQTPEQFAEVKEISDLIVHVRITDYKTVNNSPHDDDGWTTAAVVHVFKGVAPESVKISGWVSFYPPLYVYNKGSEAVLLLKREGAKWRLTDMNWKSCVPSVIGLPVDMDAAQKEQFIRTRLGALD